MEKQSVRGVLLKFWRETNFSSTCSDNKCFAVTCHEVPPGHNRHYTQDSVNYYCLEAVRVRMVLTLIDKM